YRAKPQNTLDPDVILPGTAGVAIEPGPGIDLWNCLSGACRLAPLLTLLCVAIPSPAVCQDSASQGSPLARSAPQGPNDVVVSESYRSFAGGRDLQGGREAQRSSGGAPAMSALELGVGLTPGLEIGPGHTVQMSAPPPAPRAGGRTEAATAARQITLQPVA